MYRFLLTRRWLGWLAAALAAAAVMTLLGFWQLSRYEERSATNARIDAADTSAPAPLSEVFPPPAPGEQVGPGPADDTEWAMVTVTGRFDPAHEVLVRSRTLQGRVGFEVVTPLVLPDGTALLVDRGWVAPHQEGFTRVPSVPPAPTGEVTVVGRVRPAESGGRPVEEVEGVLQTRRITPTEFAAQLPYPLYGGYVQLAEPAEEGLTPMPPRRENAWLNGGYTVQWWLFAAMVLVGYVWFARKEARQLQQPAAAPALAGENGNR